VFDNRLELFNTTYVSILFIFSIAYSDFYDTTGIEDILGMISIGLISFFILINLLIVFYQAYLDFKLIFIKYYRFCKYKFCKVKPKSKLNEIVPEETIKDALKDADFINKKPKRVLKVQIVTEKGPCIPLFLKKMNINR
jgi:hypothetical protein